MCNKDCSLSDHNWVVTQCCLFLKDRLRFPHISLHDAQVCITVSMMITCIPFGHLALLAKLELGGIWIDASLARSWALCRSDGSMQSSGTGRVMVHEGGKGGWLSGSRNWGLDSWRAHLISSSNVSIRNVDQHEALTAIPITIEGHETAFNGFWYQFTTEKPLQNVQLTINYYGNGSMRAAVCVLQLWWSHLSVSSYHGL